MQREKEKSFNLQETIIAETILEYGDLDCKIYIVSIYGLFETAIDSFHNLCQPAVLFGMAKKLN